jgi:hypothetical protein
VAKVGAIALESGESKAIATQMTSRVIWMKYDVKYNCGLSTVNSKRDAIMTQRELLLQELESTSDELLTPVLQFLQFLKAHPEESADLQLDTLETIISLRQGLAECDRGEGIPAAQALEDLQHRLQIPPRP